MKAFHYLFNRPSGVVGYTRIDQKTIALELPGADPVRGIDIPEEVFQPTRYELALDARVRQTLVVFDGNLLPDGLPRSSQLIHQEERGLIFLPKEMVRQPAFGLDTPYVKRADLPTGEFCGDHIKLVRHFILLPTGKACVQGWQPPAFTAKYRMVEVEKAGDGIKVTWRNSDS